MLVLSRKANQKIVIPEAGITITVVEIDRGKIRLGFEAPGELRIFREELLATVEQRKPEPEPVG